MLPTYPKLERMRMRRNLDAIHARSRELSPFARLIRAHVQYEGRQSAILREGGEMEDVPMQAIGAEVRVKERRLDEYTEDALDALIEDAAQQLAHGLDTMFTTTMNDVTAKTGNVVEGDGSNSSEDLFLEMMEKVEHKFDEAGHWLPPTMIGGSQATASMAAMRLSPQGRERLGSILERKHDDFRGREAARILVG